MKKLFTAALLLIAAGAFAQSAKVASAYIEYKKGALDEAFRNIEEAIQDPKTGIEPKTWKYRFDILVALAQSPKLEHRALMPVEKLGEEIKRSYEKTVEYDKKNQFVTDINENIDFKRNLMFNQAIVYFNTAQATTTFIDLLKEQKIMSAGGDLDAAAFDANKAVLKQKVEGDAKDSVLKCINGPTADVAKCLKTKSENSYKIAAVYFAQSAGMWELIGKADTTSLYYGAVAADRVGLDTIAIELYKEMIKSNPKKYDTYYLLADLYKRKNRPADALKVIKEGRSVFPTDLTLIISELNFYLSDSTKVKETEELLQLAIKNDPNNDELLLVIGRNMETQGKMDQASQYYIKAASINPSNYKALFNAGVMVFNEGAELYNKANNLDVNKKALIEELSKKATTKFQESAGYFEKAHNIDPKDYQVMDLLVKIYLRTEETEKMQEMKKKRDAAKQ